MLMPLETERIVSPSVGLRDEKYQEWLIKTILEQEKEYRRSRAMGEVLANLTLRNYRDVIAEQEERLTKESIRQKQVVSLVDTGAFTLAINEEIRGQLGLDRVMSVRSCLMADGNWKLCDLVGPVEVLFENRQAVVPAVVIPGLQKILLGQQPLEQMDVLINPCSQQLVVNPAHPDGAVMMLY